MIAVIFGLILAAGLIAVNSLNTPGVWDLFDLASIPFAFSLGFYAMILIRNR